jgi:hypothetical protein
VALTDARRGLPLPESKSFTGLLILGWGLFNLVEGIIDHHILRLHHVRDLPMHAPLYDWLFLGIGGVGFILLGWRMARGPVPAEMRTVTALREGPESPQLRSAGDHRRSWPSAADLSAAMAEEGPWSTDARWRAAVEETSCSSAGHRVFSRG